MTRNDLVIRLAGRLSIDPEDAAPCVEQFMDVVLDALGSGERIEVRNFGSFQIMESKPRRSRNPRTGEEVFVGTRRTVKFKAGKMLRARIRGSE